MKGRHAKGAAVVAALVAQLESAGFVPVREHRFHTSRKWRFDVALVPVKVACEVDGGKFRGGHSRGDAYDQECAKFNEATLLGWRVFRVTHEQVRDGSALALIRAAVQGGKVQEVTT